MTGFRSALAFLTVLPAGDVKWSSTTAADAVAWYPFVGLLIGLLLGGAERTADAIWPGSVVAAIVVALWAALTGALHLDGLGDAADAVFAPVVRERRLEILHDVHYGTFAVAAVVLVLGLKAAVLIAAPVREASAIVLVATTAGRAAIAPAMRIFPAASVGGLGQVARTGATNLAIGAGLLLTAAVAVVALGWEGVVVATIAMGAGLLCSAFLARRLGGLNGDCYGALVELVEVTTLLAGSALVPIANVSGFPLWSGR